MTHNEFNSIITSINALSPDQMRQLLRELESRMATTAKRPSARKPTAEVKAKRDAAKPMTKEEFHRHLMAIGLISQLPDTEADFDDPDDEPITIKGEPLSETVIRERR